jgi:ubiquinone biosynthesis protein UbiJ
MPETSFNTMLAQRPDGKQNRLLLSGQTLAFLFRKARTLYAIVGKKRINKIF